MIAVESEIWKSPSLKPGILRNGLQARNSGSGEPGAETLFSSVSPFSAPKARVLRTKGDSDEP
jgi:hypothetical protein